MRRRARERVRIRVGELKIDMALFGLGLVCGGERQSREWLMGQYISGMRSLVWLAIVYSLHRDWM